MTLWPYPSLFRSGLVAGIAVVVVIGVLNAYVPAFSNLAASLGRDGHLPKWFAVGAEPGVPPRRALLLTAALVVVYFGVFALLRLDLEAFVLIHTSSMVVVYVLGMVAAVRLLERWSVGWWLAAISVVLTAGLLVLAGIHLLVPAILTVIAIAVTVVRKVRARA